VGEIDANMCSQMIVCVLLDRFELTVAAGSRAGLLVQAAALAPEPGRELFDLPDEPRPDPETPAPVRFLADYDNLLLSHADRSRFIGEVERATFTYQDGPIPGMLLLDGTALGQWHVRHAEGTATMVLRLTWPLSRDHEAAVRSEADALLRFSIPQAKGRSVELTHYARPRRT